MTIDEYKQLLKNLKDAQGELTSAVCCDLQRLAGAEAESTKNRVREAYARGVEEMWEAAKTMRTMGITGFNEYFSIDHPEIKFVSDIWDLPGLDVIKLCREYNAKKKAEAEIQGVHVGDEVLIQGYRGIVIAVEDDVCSVLFPENACAMRTKASECKKTGRKFKDAKVLAEWVKALREEMK